MTNEAISAILEHLCNEARNSVHATFGVMEVLRDVAVDSARQATVAIGTTSADRLLRSIDDVRDLISPTPWEPSTPEEFDLSICASEIIEVLRLASARRVKRVVLDAPPQPLPVIQDRKAIDQMFMRVLDTAFKLTQTSEVRVTLGSGSNENSVRMSVAARDGDLAVRIAKWLNADLNVTTLADSGDVQFGIAVMVAGKRLRALGGSVEVATDSAGHAAVAIELPARAPHSSGEAREPSTEDTQSDALSILVAEDCDDSFALSELMLQNEKVVRAHDGEEALRMIQKQRFDVVFMDIHMPGMDGYQTIRCMRDWETQTGNARTPMVVLSSDDLDTQRRSAAQSGCSGFLRKPLRGADLTGLLDRLKQARTLVA